MDICGKWTEDDIHFNNLDSDNKEEVGVPQIQPIIMSNELQLALKTLMYWIECNEGMDDLLKPR